MSVFSLEALSAKQGDCLLLHWGEDESGRLALIDGGPSGVYDHWLSPRLKELAGERRNGPLGLELVLVSHIDDDHIHGVLELFDACAEAKEDESPAPYAIDRLWHNAFHTLADQALGGTGATAVASAAVGAGGVGGACAASVKQGVQLQTYADLLRVPINDGHGGLIAAPSAHELPSGLKLTVISPAQRALADLRKKWERETEQQSRAAALATAYSDTSVYNLSSIVVWAELGRWRMLLTGDARGDDILVGLEAADLMDREGNIEVDLLKVPHHGSERNVEPAFFSRIRARHYVISADGNDGNPKDATLAMLLDGRDDAEFTVHLTNRDGKGDLRARMDAFLDRTSKRGIDVRFRDPGTPSLVVDLGDAPV